MLLRHNCVPQIQLHQEKYDKYVYKDESPTRNLPCLSQRPILHRLSQRLFCPNLQKQKQQDQIAHDRDDVGIITNTNHINLGHNLRRNNLIDYEHMDHTQKNSYFFSDNFSTSTHYSRHYIVGPAPLAAPLVPLVSPALGTTILVPEDARSPLTSLSSRSLAAAINPKMFSKTLINASRPASSTARRH